MGYSSATGLPTQFSPTQNLVWKISPGPGTSSPVVFGSKIFLTTFRGYNDPTQPGGSQESLKLFVLCLDRETGETLWTKEVAPDLPEQDRIREGHGYASSTPVVDAERLYVFFGVSGVHAFDHNGKHLWKHHVGKGLNGWGSGASLSARDNLLFVNASVESGKVFALDKQSGEEVWQAGGIRESWAMPVVVDDAQGRPELIVPIQGKILAFDPQTGTPRWNCKTDIAWYMVPSVVAADGVVYAIGGRSGVAALAVRTGGQGDVTQNNRLWTGNNGSNVSSPIFHEGHIYWMHEGLGVAYCAVAATGEVVYNERLNRAGQIYASPILADGKLYYLSRTGQVYVIAARPEFELLATNDISDRSTFNASPAVAGNRLLIRSDKHLYCFGNN